ncbi:TetR/AcrR family transcriptional regulator [Oceanibium sediminis]|uniref:TetR/AcrR family transcriptional regulator n=1 Tax=Oceanibium sediminis TaxID=2026339 RepID=UPI000DD3128A|nr:TetR/AcrR family transcriptional regulator [Oceanibium sediminis]
MAKTNDLAESDSPAETRPGARDDKRETNPRKELVREQLMDIAARMFDEQGYDRCSMTAIANEVGLGRSAIYHYFSSKDDILSALIDAEALEPSKRLNELAQAESGSASERLRAAIIDGVVRRLSSGARFVRLARLEAQIPDHLMGRYNESRRQIYNYYVACIDEGMASGEFRQVDSHIAAFGVIGMANWTSRWYRTDGRMSAHEIGETLADLALAGLRSDGQNERLLNEARGRLRTLGEEIDSLNTLLG